jgi:hypothetical protein
MWFWLNQRAPNPIDAAKWGMVETTVSAKLSTPRPPNLGFFSASDIDGVPHVIAHRPKFHRTAASEHRSDWTLRGGGWPAPNPLLLSR